MYKLLAWNFFYSGICKTPFNRKLGKNKKNFSAIGARLVDWLAVFIVNSISRLQV